MDLRERRELTNSIGDGLSRAFELVMTPALMGILGYLLDRWIGTVPLFTITLVLFTLGYECVKLWQIYDAEMKRHEAKLLRRSGTGAGGPTP